MPHTRPQGEASSAPRPPHLVYLVTQPIRLLGAEPGDELVISPTQQVYPLILVRRFPLELAAAIPGAAVTLLSGGAPSGARARPGRGPRAGQRASSARRSCRRLPSWSRSERALTDPRAPSGPGPSP